MYYANPSRRHDLFDRDIFAIKYPSGKSIRNKLSKRMFIDIAFWGDFIGIVLLGFAIEFFYLTIYLDEIQGFSFYPLCILVVTAAVTVGLRRQGYYQDLVQAGSWCGHFSLFVIVTFAFGIAVFGLFAIKLSDYFSRVWFISWLFTAYAFLVASRLLWRHWFKSLTAAGHFRMNVAVIGSRAALPRALTFLNRNDDKLPVNLVGVYGVDMKAVAAGNGRLPRLKPQLTRIIKDCQRKHVSDVIVALSWSQWPRLGELVRELQLLPVNISVVPDNTGAPLSFRPVSELGNLRALAVQRAPISDWGIFAKMAEDYLIAFLALIIFMPAMALIAVAIKLDSKGPVFFRQRRHGFNHRVIEILKFRTMTVQEDGAQVTQATRNDLRVTRIGRILRRTSLDELPQFINVLAGQMSIVGPRPHAIAHNDYYAKLLNNYACRHRVKPGITGWAQINGFRGEVLDSTAMKERVRLDLEYIDSWSLAFDLKILLLTPFYGFFSKNAY